MGVKLLKGFPVLSCFLIANLFAESSQDSIDQISQNNLRNERQVKSKSDSVFSGFTIDGSFLYWNAKVDGYEFANQADLQITSSGRGIPSSIQVALDAEAPSFSTWDPGFQVAIGYVISQREQWHTRLSWTRFYTSSHKSVSTQPGPFRKEFLEPILVPILTGPMADKANADFTLKFNTLDWELGRQFFVGKWLSLGPKVGLRTAWIDQDFKVKYHSYFPTSAAIFAENTSFKAEQDFTGIGLKFGSDIEFYFAKCWSIIGNVSASFLMGHITVDEKVSGLILGDSSIAIPESVKFKQSLHKMRSNLEGQLGLQWQMFFYKNKFRFACAGLYSFAYWFNQNNLVNFAPVFGPFLQQPAVHNLYASQDLQLQGLNVKLGIDF